MNRLTFPAVPLFLGALFCHTAAHAQPEPKPDAPKDLTYSLVELERFIGGRTVLSVDLKEATLEEVAAALSKASHQKVTPAVQQQLPVYRMGPNGLEPAEPLPPQRFTLSASDKPFWEAILDWQLEAMKTTDGEKAELTSPLFSGRPSFDLTKEDDGFTAAMGDGLTRGRTVKAWPFLLLGTELKRSQDASLRPVGLAEPPRPQQPPKKADGATTPQAAPRVGATPEEKRWIDRLTLSTTLFVDPKLSPSDLTCEIAEAVDEKGNDLRSPEKATRTLRDRSDGFQIPLSSKPGMGKRLSRLRGVLHFSILTRSKHWETNLLQTPVEDVIQLDGDNFNVRFKGLKRDSLGWSAVFTAESRGPHLNRFWERQYHSQAMAGFSGNWGGTNLKGVLDFSTVPQIDLVDANGRSLRGTRGGSRHTLDHLRPETGTAPPPPVTMENSPAPPDAALNWIYSEEQTVLFHQQTSRLYRSDGLANPPIQPLGAPVKLIVDFPIEYRRVSVPFEFTDLPLPPS